MDPLKKFFFRCIFIAYVHLTIFNRDCNGNVNNSRQKTENSMETRQSSWEPLLQAESNCTNSFFISLEMFFGVHISSTRLVQRVQQTCPDKAAPITLDPFTRRYLGGFPFQIEHIFTHPQYEIDVMLKSKRLIHKFFTDIKEAMFNLLTGIEYETLKFIQKSPEKLRNYQIPVICGDFSVTADGHPVKQSLFYIALRKSINLFPTNSPLEFFTSPRLCRHITGLQKVVGDTIDAFPGVLKKYSLFPLYTHLAAQSELSIPASVVLGSDSSSFFSLVSDPSSMPHVELHALKDIAHVGVENATEIMMAVPFMNLGLLRSLVLLVRQYCQHDRFKSTQICLFPCFQKGWVQHCTAGSTRSTPNSLRMGITSSDVYRPARYCDIRRKEMSLLRQAQLCINLLQYNISEPLEFFRARVRNCRLIVGTGNPIECRKAIVKFLMSGELPFNAEAIKHGFQSALDVGRIRTTPLKNITVLGPFARSILTAPLDNNYLRQGTYTQYTRQPGRPSVIKLRLSTISQLATHICETPLFKIKRAVGKHLTNGQTCLRLCFLVELLLSFGARPSTNVTIEDGRVMLPGALTLMQENHHSFLEDVFEAGSTHWKNLYQVSQDTTMSDRSTGL